MKPMSNLCWHCQQNSTVILNATNCSENEKTKTIQVAEEHLRVVHMERALHKNTCRECEHSVRTHFSVNSEFQAPPPSSRIPTNTMDIKVHYSFDYAQQVHFPSDRLQPGPIYFLTPRCGVLGINCEALPWQVNSLSYEACGCGKGVNTVVSQLHYFFENHGLGEKEVNNCTGQNKNSCMDLCCLFCGHYHCLLKENALLISNSSK